MPKTNKPTVRDIVKELLAKHSNLREDVLLLYVAVVEYYKGEGYSKNISLYDYAKRAEDRIGIPSILSVVRENTYLQGIDDKLRGKNWEAKQHKEKQYREEYGHGK